MSYDFGVKLLIVAFAFAAPLAAGDGLMIAGLKLMPERWNKEANFSKLQRFARDAAVTGAELVLAPEGFLEGYVANVHANPGTTRERYFSIGEPLDGAVMGRVRGLARELKIYLGTGFAERRGARMFNSFAVFSPEGELVLHYSKSHNAADEPFNTTGTEFPVAATPLGRWGALICYDRQLPETARILAIKGAQLILVPAWGSSGEMNDAMMRTRAFENGVYVAFVHPRRCLIIDPRGKLIATDSGKDHDEVVMARILFDERVGKAAIRSRKPELYGEILKPSR
jgi:predicted amidohydrolase